MDAAVLEREVQSVLTDDLLRPAYRKAPRRHHLTGHCYVASEALFYLLGGRPEGWVPQVVRHEGGTHWYLRNVRTGRIVDPTAAQFETCPPYAAGRGIGFLTKGPSARTREVIRRLSGRITP